MRIATILSLGASIVMVAAGAGCAGLAKGPSDQELIDQALNNWKVGMETKDIAKIETLISEAFSHYEYGNREQLLGFLSSTFSQGDLDNAQVVLDQAKTTIEGDSATVYPTELTAAFGSATIEFSLKKESDGVWRVVSMNVEGV